MTQPTISRAIVRTYTDSGQVVAYAFWSDGSRTESTLRRYESAHRSGLTFGAHMHALVNRARRDGIKLRKERW